MVKASSPAASQLATRPSVKIDIPARTSPNASASSRARRPDGIGRLRVRVINASMSDSNHIFNAPEAPAPTAIASSDAKAMTRFGGVGAMTTPVKAVKTTRDITRGFSNAK